MRELEEVLDGDAKLEPAAREALEAQWTQACAAVMRLHAAGEAAAIPEVRTSARTYTVPCLCGAGRGGGDAAEPYDV